MRIWKLTPVDPADPVWKDYDTEPMFVRAESAAKAQDLPPIQNTSVYPSACWRTKRIQPMVRI
jgi:hypothetical protein